MVNLWNKFDLCLQILNTRDFFFSYMRKFEFEVMDIY